MPQINLLSSRWLITVLPATNACAASKSSFIALADDDAVPPTPLPHGCWEAPSLNNPGKSPSAAIERYLRSVDNTLLGPLERLEQRTAGRSDYSDEVRVLTELARDTSIIFKKAAKGASICIMDRADYVAEVLSERHLGNTTMYVQLPSSPEFALYALNQDVNIFLDEVFTRAVLPADFRTALTVHTPRLGLFYLQPKTHKVDPALPLRCACRGIVSLTNHPTGGLSRWIHELLKPILDPVHLPELLRDSRNMLTTLDEVRDGIDKSLPGASPITSASVPFSADVEAIYVLEHPTHQRCRSMR